MMIHISQRTIDLYSKNLMNLILNSYICLEKVYINWTLRVNADFIKHVSITIKVLY